MILRRPLAVALGAAVLLIGLSGAALVGEPINSMCPVMPDQKVDPRITIAYEGRTIAFCCLKCRKQFQGDPGAYLALLPGFEGETAMRPSEEVGSGAARAEPGAARGGPGEDRVEGIDRAVRFAGRFHPVLVHFPIALILATALAEVLRLRSRAAWLEGAARFTRLLAAAGAAVAAPIGWAAAAFSSYPGETETLELHRWTGTAAAALILLAAVAGEAGRRRPRLRPLYGVALALAVLTVGAAGHLGGTLIYGPDPFAW